LARNCPSRSRMSSQTESATLISCTFLLTIGQGPSSTPSFRSRIRPVRERAHHPLEQMAWMWGSRRCAACCSALVNRSGPGPAADGPGKWYGDSPVGVLSGPARSCLRARRKKCIACSAAWSSGASYSPLKISVFGSNWCSSAGSSGKLPELVSPVRRERRKAAQGPGCFSHSGPRPSLIMIGQVPGSCPGVASQ